MIRPVTSARGVQGLLAAAGVRPSKRLGQNFLVDASVLSAIDDALAEVSPAAILEIGAGLGAVTEVLVRRAQAVVAIEIDRRLANVLRARLGERSGLTVRDVDILRFDPVRELRGPSAYVVGSLPYRITAPILKWLVDHREALSGALLITQREVASKIAASPGKDGSALGVLVRAYADVEVVREIGRESFFPVPEVDSTLWSLAWLERPRFESSPVAFFAAVRALYGNRRKMIRGALRTLLPADAIGEALAEAGIDGAARGEDLDFGRLDRLAAAIGGRIDDDSSQARAGECARPG